MRSEGYGSWVCLSVCLSVKSHLTSGASVRPEIYVTYSTGDKGQKICEVFSETSTRTAYRAAAIFPAHSLTNKVCQLACMREFDVNYPRGATPSPRG